MRMPAWASICPYDSHSGIKPRLCAPDYEKVSKTSISAWLAHWPIPPQSPKHCTLGVYAHFCTCTPCLNQHKHTHKPIPVYTNPFPIRYTDVYRMTSSPHAADLYDLALLVTDPHDDLNVLLRSLVVFVEVAAL